MRVFSFRRQNTLKNVCFMTTFVCIVYICFKSYNQQSFVPKANVGAEDYPLNNWERQEEKQDLVHFQQEDKGGILQHEHDKNQEEEEQHNLIEGQPAQNAVQDDQQQQGVNQEVHQEEVQQEQQQGNSDGGRDIGDHIEGEEPVIYSHEYAAKFERFGVGAADFKFLRNFKSPCWLEDSNDPFPYNGSRMWLGNPKYIKMSCFTDGLKKSKPTFVQLPGMDRSYRLRCFPYFMLLGVAKSGTSDIQSRVLETKYIFKGFSKELYYWDQYRFVPNATLSDYSDLLDFAVADMIKLKEEAPDGSPYWPGAVGEMTSITLSDVAYWRDDPRNAGLREPKYLTPHDLRAVIPNVKLIVLMRNPVTRLYSHYNMWSPLRKFDKSPEDFHMRIVNSLKWWHDCTHILPVRNCLYGSPPEMPPVEHTLSSWWPSDSNHSGEIRTGLYYLLLSDWLSAFPRESFLFIRSEDYNMDKLSVMNNQVFPFLGIPPVFGEQADKIADIPNRFQQTYLPMLPETKELLLNFYQPYNDKLAELLGEERWAWRD